MIRNSIVFCVAFIFVTGIDIEYSIADGFDSPAINAPVNGGDTINFQLTLDDFDGSGYLVPTSATMTLTNDQGVAIKNVPLTSAWLSPSAQYQFKNSVASPTSYPNQTASLRLIFTVYYDPGGAIYTQRVIIRAVSCTQK